MTSPPSIRKMIFVSPLKQPTSPSSFTTSPLPADDTSLSLDTSTSTLDLTTPVTYSNPAELDFVNRVPASRNRIIKRKPATTLSSPSTSKPTKPKSPPARNIPGKRKLLPKSIDLVDDTTTTSAQVPPSSSQNDTAPTTATATATTRPTGKTLTSSSSTTSRSKQLSADDIASLPTSIESSSSAPAADPPPYDLSAPAPAPAPPLSLIPPSQTSSSSVWARKLLFQATEAREKYEAAAVRLATTESSWQTIMQSSISANQAAVDDLRRSIAEVAGQASELKQINQDLAVCLTDMRRVIALNSERIDSADQGIKLLAREMHDLKAYLHRNSPSSTLTSHEAVQQQDIPVKQESRPANHPTSTQTHIIAISSDAASDEFDLLLPPITSDNRRSLHLDD
ncbi:hypothetical protein BZA70DRAFT_144884 [Myxozyma melibiosi]|uniref:Uncharacterized protein n=1 Tax=Myxozyma melibiosi TaxID=54550 RepID=A0ABR1F7N1_9ASCO